MKSFLKQTGDTIVEVMIGLTVLAVAMATVYGIGSRSLHAGIEAKKRTEALGLAQSQIDYLITAAADNKITTYGYNTTSFFCIPSYGQRTVVGSDRVCSDFNGNDGGYDIGIKYDATSKIY